MHKSYGVSKFVEYLQIDMKNIDLPDGFVDVVVFKSVIGALGNKKDQQKALNEIYRVLKPGGKFLFAENLEGSAVHKFLRKKFVGWGKRWCYINDADMKNWTGKFQTYKSKTYGVLGLFGRSEAQRNFLGIIDKVLTPIVPKKWRYILFGVLTK